MATPHRSFWQAVLDYLEAIGNALINLGNILGTPGHIAARWLLRNLTFAAIKYEPELIGELDTILKPAVDALTGLVQSVAPPILSELEKPLRDWASKAFAEKLSSLSSIGASSPENAQAIAANALADAFGFGMASAVTAAAFEACFPEKLNVLNGIAPILAELAGFREVVEVVIDKLYDNAFGRSLEYAYRARFKPELPSEQNAVHWHAQRLLSDDQLRGLFEYSGLKSAYEPAFIASAYHPVQPRALTTLFEDQAFPRGEVASMLEFAGIRDADKHVLLDAFEWNSTKNVRHQYLAALLATAETGLLEQATVDSHLDTLHFSQDAKNWVHLTVALKRLQKQSDLYIRSVSTMYMTGQLSDAQYVPALEAIGLAENEANAHYGVDSARLKGKILAQEERAATKAAEQLLREQIAAIRAEYMEA